MLVLASLAALCAVQEHAPPALPERVRILVLDEDDRAQAGVSARVWDEHLVALLHEIPAGSCRGALFPSLERLARPLRSDEHGLIEFEHAGGELLVTGPWGALDPYGVRERAERNLRDSDWNLARPLPTVAQLLVVDANGRPASDLSLRLLGRPSGVFAGEADIDLHAWLSSRNGRAELVDEAAGVRLPTNWHSVEVRGPFADPIRLPLGPPPSDHPDAPLKAVIQLPPTGSVLVRVTEVDLGPSAPLASWVHLRREGELAANWSPWPAQVASHSEVLYSHVGLGLQLVVEGGRLASTHCAEALHIAGPTRPGERVEVELIVEREFAAISGRLIAPDGEPLRRRAVPLDGLPLPVIVDEEGRFLLESPAEDFPPVRLAFGAGASRLESPLIEWSEEQPLRDLGALELLPAPVLAAGRVVDAQGVPLEGVRVEEHGRGFGEHTRTDNRLDWRLTQTDAGGAFALHGSLDAERVYLLLSDLSGARKEVLVPRGSEDLELQFP